jgi:hypothetical protein
MIIVKDTGPASAGLFFFSKIRAAGYIALGVVELVKFPNSAILTKSKW